MKLLLLVVDAAFEDLLLDKLEKNEIKQYTKIEKVLGVGKSSDPHLDSHIWPGYHNLYIITVSEEKYNEFKPEIIALKKKLKGKGFKVFVIKLAEVV